jgi:hypothetical protein
MMEHALVIAAMLPGDELAPLRQQAVGFAQSWGEYLARLRTGMFDATGFAKINAQTIDLLEPYIGFKQQLLAMQDNGQIFSFVYPSFATEVLDEALHFASTLRQLSSNGNRDLGELVPFWANNMEAHSRMTAHLLDPSEEQLIQQAVTSANQWATMKSAPPDFGTIGAALDVIISFKQNLQEGIKSGAINSIIHPTLADHLRREAVKARDEVRFLSGA